MKNDGSGVQISGIDGDPPLYARVLGLIQRHLDRVGLRPVSGRATFTDENGPKGGRAMRCALTVTLPYRPRIHVERTGTDQRRAFDAAIGSLGRELRRYRERDRVAKRRPKKYFAARQADAVGASSPARPDRRSA